MRVFNRIVVILLLAGLVALGVFVALYGFGLFGYRPASLSGLLDSFRSGLVSFVSGVESGSAAIIAVLVAVAILGLILLVLELKPGRPRRVRMGKGTYVPRDAVKTKVTEAAGQTTGMLGSSAKVKAKRRPGAKVKLKASVRRGEDPKAMKSSLQDAVRRHLDQSGVPLGKLKIKVNEADPRQTKTRVQ